MGTLLLCESKYFACIVYNPVQRYRLEYPMQIILPPELEQLVQRQINSGKYQTEIAPHFP